MSVHTKTGDRHAQFLISVYELCAAAHIGHLQVEIASSSGERNVGVPTVGHEQPVDGSEPESAVVIWIEQQPIILDHITRCTITNPFTLEKPQHLHRDESSSR